MSSSSQTIHIPFKIIKSHAKPSITSSNSFVIQTKIFPIDKKRYITLNNNNLIIHINSIDYESNHDGIINLAGYLIAKTNESIISLKNTNSSQFPEVLIHFTSDIEVSSLSNISIFL